MILKQRVGLWLLGCLCVWLVSGCTPEETILPEVSEANLQSNVKSNEEFSLAIYREFAKSNGNVFLSPYSIYSALSMTAAGAKGQTLTEMKQTLHHKLSGKDLHDANGWLLGDLNRRGKRGKFQLSVVNRIWSQQGMHLIPEFVDIMGQSYRADVELLDFTADADGARETINVWVEEQTKNKINELLPEGSISGNTRMVLTNAVYFKGDWKTSFKKNKTYDGQFVMEGGSSVSAQMMTRNGEALYGESDSVKLLELPYKGDELSMVLILPKSGVSLKSVESQMSSAQLKAWSDMIGKREKVSIHIPKFRFATPSVSLKKMLKEMGMVTPFHGGADFSAMTTAVDLYIDEVYHKAFIDVNEKGTEAAAATAVVMNEKSIFRGDTFRADRPFLFLIRDNMTKNILFLGRIAKPEIK